MIIKATKVKDMTFFQRDNGSYQSKVTVNGKRKTFYGKTKNEVRLKYQEYLHELETNNSRLQSDDLTLNEYIEYWLPTYKLRTIEPSSYDKLERVYNNQIHNTIGRKHLREITTEDIQSLIDNYASPKDDKTTPLAKSGLKRIRQLINQCYEKAVEEKRVEINPCKGVFIPKDIFIDTKTKEQFSLDYDEMEELKELCLIKNKTIKQDTYKYRDGLILMIILNTGLRCGEMLALEWSDVDLKNKTLNINKIVQDKVVDRTDKSHKRVDKVKDGSKTSCGRRVIPINDNIVFYFKEIQKNNKLLGINSNYVACTKVGTRQTHRNLLRSLSRMVKRGTIIPEETTLHTLRHTFGSTLIRKGISIEIVSKLMGHANIMVTYNKYIHVINEEKAKAMELVNIV